MSVISAVNERWGSRHGSNKLPRLFFRYFRETSFVVEEDEELIAFRICFTSTDAGEAYIRFAGGRPAHREQGVSRRLNELFFEEAGRRVGCNTPPVNEGSIAFHTRVVGQSWEMREIVAV